MTKFIQSKWRVGLSLFFLDAITLIALFNFFTVIRRGGDLQYEDPVLLLILPLAFTFIALYIVNGYSLKTNFISLNYAVEHILSCVAAAGLTVISIYSFTLVPANQFSRAVLPLSFLTFPFLSLFYRRLFFQKAANLFGHRYFLILGSGDLARKFYQDCKKSKIKHGFRVVDINSANVGKPMNGENSPIIQSDLIKELKLFGHRIDGIIIAEDRRGVKEDVLEKLIFSHFQGTPVYSIEEFYDNYFHKIPFDIVRPHILLRGGFHLARSKDFENFKRLTDITISFIALVLASPLLLIIAILVRLDSKGPVIFKQERVGKNNISFMVNKFRTMQYEPEHKGDLYTQSNDQRITRMGKWLRQYRLDELPQIINVLKGDMSFIGPRAEWIKLTKTYEEKIQCYDIRHLVKPGITGWAQVNYPYGANIQDTITKFEYDLYYIRHYSLKLDAAIILKTIYTVLFGKGL